jgi:hypothetical protein
MNQSIDWAQKLRHAIERITKRYEHIGRKTGAPFLAIVYPPDSEREVLMEWKTLTDSLYADYDFREIDAMALTTAEVEKHGVENIVALLEKPMPGSNAKSELGQMWVTAVANAVKEESQKSSKSKRIVVVLRGLAALYPATGPRAVMQTLWDSQQSVLAGPVVVFIPGSLVESRVYSFLNLREEFMYRGDVL